MARDTQPQKPSTTPSTGGGSSRPTSARGGKAASAERKARVEQMQRDQKARERRTVLLIVAGCTALVLLLAGVIAYGVVDSRRNQPDQLIGAIGVPAASASCDAVTSDPASGNADHVGPGTSQANVTKIPYSTVPPTSGSHFVSPAIDGRGYYTTADRPAIETLVHNLEHGYTILWYLPSEAEASGAQLQELAATGNKLSASSGKFIVAPWEDSYGKFPAGKKFALSHWSATTDSAGAVQSQAGHRQLCGSLSGEVVQSFVNQFPRTDAPEPNGA